MSRSKPGDIYEIEVLNYFAYLQHIKTVKEISILAKVFTRLHLTRPMFNTDTVSGPSFRVFYPIDVAEKEMGLVRRIGNEPLSEADSMPLLFRFGNVLFHEGLEKRVIRVSDLSDEDRRKWPVYKVASHPLILKTILLANGIDVSSADLKLPASTQTPVANTLFFLYYKSEETAKLALSSIQSSQQFIRLSFVVEETCDEEWLLRVDGEMSVPISEVHLTMQDVALRFGGRYDGFERPLSAE